MALTDMESSPILSGEEEITIVPRQRRRRNVPLVLLYAVGFVAAVLGVYVGAPMKMIRVATWASTVKLWSNSGTITNSGSGNVVGDNNNVQQGDVSSTSTDDHSVHINNDNRKDSSSTDNSIKIGGSVGGSVGDNNVDKSITNDNISGSMVNNGDGQQKSCEGSGNDGSGAGAVGTVCCASLTGEVACDHASSGDHAMNHTIKAMSKLKNSDKVTKSDKLRKAFDEKCEHTMKDLISDQKTLDFALTVVCKAHAAQPALLPYLTPGCEWIPQDNCVDVNYYACKCRRENPNGPCTTCESAGGSRPKASGR